MIQGDTGISGLGGWSIAVLLRVIASGKAGLVPIGVEPDALISDIRECARVCREERPDPTLEFIEYIQPVGDAALKGMLDGKLEKLLSGAAADAGERLVPVVPASSA